MDYYGEMLARYRNKGLLIDTGLLLLLIVGILDPSRITRFKRTQTFSVEDYDLLKKIVNLFAKLATTPNILTEVSNLLRQLPTESRHDFSRVFTNAIEQVEEHYQPSRELARRSHFPVFGLTDSSIIDSCKGKYLVLTDDLPLSAYLTNLGLDAINFNHLRPLAWEFIHLAT